MVVENTEPRKCTDCQRSFDAVVTIILERRCVFAFRCNECQAIATEKAEQEKIAAEQKIITDGWEAIAPVLYRDSDISRFPKKLQQIVADFDPVSQRGFGFSGRAGSCKTRASFQMLKVAHFRRHSCATINGVDFAKLSIDQFNDTPISGGSCLGGNRQTIGTQAKRQLRRLADCDWALLDDLDKCKFTPRAEEALYDILESRTSNARPTIWTCNANSHQLAAMFTEERSEAILRRLDEFAEVITL
jgi:DNA replication protein DnaC